MDDDMKKLFSAAMTEEVDYRLRKHLSRQDEQEDLCFALYRPSSGRCRFTALICDPLLPAEGERQVHFNVSFNPSYFERALGEAIKQGCGLALLHSHPGAKSWQGMSSDDRHAESGMAAAVKSGTGLPFIGLTLSTASGFWSGRNWIRVGPRQWEAQDCENVRVVGKGLTSWTSAKQCEGFPESLKRTVHAWGGAVQRKLSGLRLGIVGLGSVGSLVTEELARMGFVNVVGIDFDIIKEHNRDRTLHAYQENVVVGESKVQMAAMASVRSSTMPGFRFHPVPLGINTTEAYREALDCDVIFCCVDRPWPRSILNHLAYSHLIPVIDGGISVSRKANGSLRSADWGAFVAGPARRCLACSKQFEPGLVALERDGFLDDLKYIESLPEESPLKESENVFAFSMALAAMEVLKLVQLVARPCGLTAPMCERYSFPSGSVLQDFDSECHEFCSYRDLIAKGDMAGNPGIKDWQTGEDI
jgi:hypothetical protein